MFYFFANKGGEAIVNSKHFVKDHLGLDMIISTNQCKHSQSMDQSETRESSTVLGKIRSPRLLSRTQVVPAAEQGQNGLEKSWRVIRRIRAFL